MAKNKTISVKGTEITIIQYKDADYLSMTDMVRNFEDGLVLIEKCLEIKTPLSLLAFGNK